ncbi:2939_t:CDS:10 [Gigaspora margarita]|uniref:2939_t:CDS:1 n=1 Tax=Gigaspora margarita TaxID=4874 RepID=A0ABN7UC49_GIGMA|nr:2939_t:CDS:10 [Gigaspora margarita]
MTLSFGLIPIELDPTEFITYEFTKELFVSLIEPSLKEQNLTGIFSFLDKIPTNSLSKILSTFVAANIPIPIYLSNDTHSQKGLKVLNELHDVIVAHKYHLFISVNQANTDYLETPFTKQLYKTYLNNREDCSGICNPNSIDISFHAASENYSRPSLAISEIYYDEPISSALSDIVKKLTKFAFYIVIHVSNKDFVGNELNDQFISTVNDISIECYGSHKRKILILFSGIKPQYFSKHKETIEELLCEKFTNDELWIELVVNNKKNALFERIKKDSFHKLKDTENPWLYWNSLSFTRILDNSTEDFLSENDFALSIAELGQFTCRADIFYASYCENEIETLKDKKHLETPEDSQNYKAESDINRDIMKFQNKQQNIRENRPIPVLMHFANVIKTNDIKYMREFARQADVYFKDHLISLTQKDDKIKNNTVESDTSNIQRKEIKQQIEDLDITIHDFWKEFVILSKLIRSDGSSTLKKLYDIDNKQLKKAYSVWICEGEAIQILEGPLDLKVPENLHCLITCFNVDFQPPLDDGARGYSAYMSYRHTSYKKKELDVLIIDSKGMGSTAAKYISRRTDFDKKMTLLGLMCSQILIVNTKGLTRDILDILEVFSYHIDALSNRDSNKPRICFVLRDMKDAKKAQNLAFLNILDSLKKMFNEILGSYDMDDFMIVEERDVHLLENAFTCSFDDFYPQSMITDSENFHYPAETFPIKISKLRKELLNSALIPSENHRSQIFKNVYGFITHMQAVWKEIDVRGNFLHFKDSKTIIQWSEMKKLVHGYGETTIKSYLENALNLIGEKTSKEQWNEDNETAFENELTQETELWCTKTIADFKEKISNQYEPQIIDEGENNIKAAFATKKRKLKATYAKSQRESKESWLIKSATMRIGETVGKIFREHNDKTPEEFRNIFSDSKRKELFNEEWKKVENDKENFMRTMIMEEDKLEQHVVTSFNQAIINRRAINNNSTNKRNSEERLKFNRIFWNKVSTPATLNKSNSKDIDTQLINSIKITEQTYTKKNDFKDIVIIRIKTKIKDTCGLICDDLFDRNALAIEFNQALEWLELLCNNIFILYDKFNNSHDHFKVKIEDFSPAEQYLRYQVFNEIKNNTTKWKSSQQKNLNKLCENLLNCFNDILSNSSYENIFSHFFKYVAESVETQLVIQEQYISEILESHLKQNWMSEERNPTRYAYEQSFGEYDVEKTLKERLKKIENDIKDALEKLGEIILVSQQHFSETLDKNLTLEKIILFKRDANFVKLIQRIFTRSGSSNETICPESLIENSIHVLGKCIISSPQDFYIVLKEDYNKYIQEFNTLWKTQRADLCKKSLINSIEISKNSYWNKVKGCPCTCPYCGSKCELAEHESNTNHRASIHLMNCFGGINLAKTREANLIICNEPKNFDATYHKGDENGLIFEKFTKKYYPEWWSLLGRKQPDDDQIKQVRAMWVNLKDELCRKFDMKDKTPENWCRDYKYLVK